MKPGVELEERDNNDDRPRWHDSEERAVNVNLEQTATVQKL